MRGILSLKSHNNVILFLRIYIENWVNNDKTNSVFLYLLSSTYITLFSAYLEVIWRCILVVVGIISRVACILLVIHVFLNLFSQNKNNSGPGGQLMMQFCTFQKLGSRKNFLVKLILVPRKT